MDERISPASHIRGSIHLPGDKSISHRYAMLAAIAEGTTRIRNYSTGADCASTLGAIRKLGIGVEQGPEVTICGRGLEGLTEPAGDLDCGNSGSTMRMLSGILAGQPFRTRLVGDESLSRRPMGRILTPLGQMGASVTAREGRFPPLEIRGAFLKPIDYTLPVASAQVKSCVLLAGLYAEGETTVREPVRSRNHTEIALREFGAELRVSDRVITVRGRGRLTGRVLSVPSDISSAAFFIVAALMSRNSELLIEGVGLNPTRSALVGFLQSMGARVEVLNRREQQGEPAGDVLVRDSQLEGGVLEGETAAQLIDEIPVLAVLGAVTDRGLEIRDAAELRVKETDRIATVTENLRRMGVSVNDTADGLAVAGRQSFHHATLDSYGDHRIAMAFAVAALRADGECLIQRAEAASVSFPGFYDILRLVAE